uniref:Uracil phosphoribosyltransferase homolog n=1 Tax=Plectus sambesii TaxID=2011161 RepID=A0A914V6G5_9BILA
MSSIGETTDRLRVLPNTDQVKELQTILRDRQTTHSDFVFYADRLIRLVVEEGLNQLPYTKCTVVTPTGREYLGIAFAKGNCGVSICRSGEAMEKGLRECCRSIRIGKVLIDSDPRTNDVRVLYARLLPDIRKRRVLLLYPLLSTGNTVAKAISVLKDSHVSESNIFLLTLFCTPHSVQQLISKFPGVTILTSEVSKSIPQYFGMKYFGTE